MTYNMLKLLNCFFLWYFYVNKCTFTWEAKLKPVWNFILVENLTSVFSQLFTCVHMNWGEMKLKPVWISYRSFWLKQNLWINLPEVKWISADWLDIAFNMHVCLKLIVGLISLRSFWQKWNFISGDKTLYHVNTIRNKIPTHVHKTIRSF